MQTNQWATERVSQKISRYVPEPWLTEIHYAEWHPVEYPAFYRHCHIAGIANVCHLLVEREKREKGWLDDEQQIG